MEIQIGSDALFRAKERGVAEEEIRDFLKTGTLTAKMDHLSKEKVFTFNQLPVEYLNAL